MSYFKAKMHQIQRSPIPLSWIKGSYRLLGGRVGDYRMEGKGRRERRKGGEKGRGKRREGKKVGTPHFLDDSDAPAHKNRIFHFFPKMI